MYSRVMSPLVGKLELLLRGDEGMRAFIRQSGHSLYRGILWVDAAARGAAVGYLPGWRRSWQGLQILLTGEGGTGNLRTCLQERVDVLLRKNLEARPWSGWTARESILDTPCVINKGGLAHGKSNARNDWPRVAFSTERRGHTSCAYPLFRHALDAIWLLMNRSTGC